MTIRKVSYMQGTVQAPYKLPAEDHRLNHSMLWWPDPAAPRGPLGVRSGVVLSPVGPFAVSVVAGGVNVAPGHAVIQGTLSTTQGAYEVTSDAVEFRAITAASPTEYRRGYVILRVYDQLNPGTGPVKDDQTIEVIYGANAASAGAAQLPALPANSLVLREFAVSNTGAITLVGSTRYTAPRNTPLLVADAAERLAIPTATVWPGVQVREIDTWRLWEWTGLFWKLLNQLPRVSVYRNALLSWASGAFAAVPWDTEIYDPWDMHSSNGLLTIPIKGIYRFSATLGWANNGVGMRGSNWQYRTGSSGAFTFITASASLIAAAPNTNTMVAGQTLLRELEAGWQLQVNGYQNAGGPINFLGTSGTPDQKSTAFIELVEQTG